jgi:hypothetical protein
LDIATLQQMEMYVHAYKPVIRASCNKALNNVLIPMSGGSAVEITLLLIYQRFQNFIIPKPFYFFIAAPRPFHLINLGIIGAS